MALPVLALVVSSGLGFSVDAQRTKAQDQREAAEAVDAGVAQVQTISDHVQRIIAASGQDPDLPAKLRPYATDWEHAVTEVGSAALRNPTAALSRSVVELRAASDELLASHMNLFSATGSGPSEEDRRRAEVATGRFNAAIAAVSTAAREQAHQYADAYDAASRRVTRLIVVAAVVGSLGAISAMVVFAAATRRRVRQLEVNARALGEGRPLVQLPDYGDELGQLGRGLDGAAALLGMRERELHEAAGTLRRSEERLGIALMSGATGTWDVDLSSGISVWDEQCLAVHGVTAEQFAGTFEGWLDLVHPDDRATVLSDGAEAISAGGRWRTEYRTSTAPDGADRWVETHGQALLDDAGKPVRLIGVARDITPRKQAEQRLLAATAEAEGASRTKNEFLSRVSHELRTPLNAILGFSQLLEMDELTDSQSESVAQVLAGGRHLLGLIEDVLDISRIEADNLTVSMEPIGLDSVVDETVALVSSLARDLGVTLEVVAGPWGASHVRADRRRLKQVLVNLASNAVKYNRPGGRVTFHCSSPSSGMLRIAVRDTGHGIAADRLDRLFTPFDRLGAETTTVDGAGIGLALSQRLAEMMDSTLQVDTTVGVGSTFSLDLPLVEDPAVAADLVPVQASAAVDEPSAGTVLYIEDNPSNLKLVQRVLDRRGGVRMLSAGTGGMALSLAGRVPVDLVLLDLHLPDMSGAEVLRLLREHPATALTRVVVLSADATPGQVERLRAAGADAFLSKPIDVTAFLATIEQYLDEAAA